MTVTSTEGDAPPTTDPAAGAATLEVEYAAQHATIRVTADPDDVDAGARLLCAAVAHLRRRHTRHVHTAVDLSGPRAGVMLDALRSRSGIDIADISMRRAGSTAMVTLELLPAPRRSAPAHDAVRHTGARPRPGDPTARPRGTTRPVALSSR